MVAPESPNKARRLSASQAQTAAETNEHYKYNAMSNREVRDVTYHANYCNENVKKHGIKVLK